MDDISRIRFVTRHYAQLQGLRLVPLGVVFLALAVWRVSGLPVLSGRLGQYAVVAAVGLAVAISFVIKRQYVARFGSVRQRLGQSGVVALTGFTALLLIVTAIDDVLVPPISLSAAAVACALTYVGLSGDGARRHYLPVAAACLLTANLRWMRIDPPIASALVDLTIGLALLVGGVGDHLVLTRTLQPLQKEDYVRPV